MSFNPLIKRDRTKKILIVEHPESGELVPWRDLLEIEKRLVIRQHFRECFDDAFNEIMFSLQDPDSNPEEGEIRDVTKGIAYKFLELLSGTDFNKTRNHKRGGFTELKEKSAIYKTMENKIDRY